MKTKRLKYWFLPLGLVLLALSCSDEDVLKKDSGAAPDQSADLAASDTGGQVDTTVADKAGQPDQLTKTDTGQPEASAPDATTAACAGVKCTLQDDCCICRAFNAGTTVPVCPTTACKQNTCGALLIKKPVTYCLKGRCLVGDHGSACAIDSDCKRVDTCCDCMAISNNVTSPSCPIKSCLVGTCTSYGLGAAKARCISGFCALSLK
jgi:hypothetical protein